MERPHASPATHSTRRACPQRNTPDPGPPQPQDTNLSDHPWSLTWHQSQQAAPPGPPARARCAQGAPRPQAGGAPLPNLAHATALLAPALPVAAEHLLPRRTPVGVWVSGTGVGGGAACAERRGNARTTPAV